MSSGEERCVGCGDTVQPGNRWILANNKILLTTWKGIFREKLDELKLDIDGDCVTKAFICRRCKRGFESYNSTRKKLLDNATNALQYINTKAADNGRKRQREDDNSNVNLPATKRPATNISVQGHSPAVQVSLFVHVHCYNVCSINHDECKHRCK